MYNSNARLYFSEAILVEKSQKSNWSYVRTLPCGYSLYIRRWCYCFIYKYLVTFEWGQDQRNVLLPAKIYHITWHSATLLKNDGRYPLYSARENGKLYKDDYNPAPRILRRPHSWWKRLDLLCNVHVHNVSRTSVLYPQYQSVLEAYQSSLAPEITVYYIRCDSPPVLALVTSATGLSDTAWLRFFSCFSRMTSQ